ncbi:MAG: HAMP domain-containing protein [Spartobacteria bacterium]|nr:HAMP domain-containing protein [Spartobacteria bacterium]
MFLRSFRLKIGLLCVLLAGLLLTGFVFFASALLNRAGIRRIDNELRTLADAQIRRTHPPDHWPRLDLSLPTIYGTDTVKKLFFQVNRADGAPIYIATNIPAHWPSDTLPLSLVGAAQTTFQSEPPPAEQPPHRPPRFRDRPMPGSMPLRTAMTLRGPVFATIHIAGAADWRAMTIANDAYQLSLAMNLQEHQREIASFRNAFILTAPFVLLLLIGGGWLIGQLALRPVNIISKTMASITARKLDQRIPDTKADAEFLQLIQLINNMLQRLETSFHQAGRFSADAAHELKTPLAILQARMEQGLQHAPDQSQTQQEYALQLEEVQRIHSILRKLLLLSQADAGRVPLSPESINFTELLRNTIEDIQMLAPDRPTSLDTTDDIFVTADPDLLTQLLQNLVSNAIKFGSPESPITLSLHSKNGKLIFTITNIGSPIAPSDQPHLFDRFYRCDPSRTRVVEGYGLGLSLARELARAHHGELKLLHSDTDSTTFELSLPVA